MSNAETIKNAAKTGNINGWAVRRIVTTLAVIENPAKSQKWFLDLATGCEMRANPHFDLVGTMQRTICQSQWRAVRYEVRGVNPVSKAYELIYIQLPLIDASVNVYRGTFKAVHLDHNEANAQSELSAEQIVGLEAGVAKGMPKRLFNILGSEAMKPDVDGFNRRYADADGEIRWNVETGDYCFTKSEACADYLAPLAGKQPDQISHDDVLDGLDAAPESTMDAELGALIARHQPTL